MSQTPASDRAHRLVPSPAGRIHLVEQGSGPLVLLVHGFPESWYSWRHQLPALAAAGYRAVAIDVRGYGRSSKPEAWPRTGCSTWSRTTSPWCDALGERDRGDRRARLGLDHRRDLRPASGPDVFRAVGLLSVPYTPPGGPRPSEVFAQMGGDGGVLRLLLPGARPGRGGDRTRRPRLARGVLRRPLRRHHARTRRPRPALRQPRRHAARPLPRRPAARLAQRGRPRRLRRGVRAHRHDRSAQPLPEHGPGLGGPRRLRRQPPSPSRRCSSAAAWTPPPPGWPTPSWRTPPPCPACAPRTSSTAAATGSSRNAPGRSTGS